MTFEEAKELLSLAMKWELRDHAFGDCEVEWLIDGKELASGYFSGTIHEVSIKDLEDRNHLHGLFKDAEADALRDCFKIMQVTRNDVTGPEEFEVGKTMYGLTKEGVLKEITSE